MFGHGPSDESETTCGEEDPQNGEPNTKPRDSHSKLAEHSRCSFIALRGNNICLLSSFFFLKGILNLAMLAVLTRVGHLQRSLDEVLGDDDLDEIRKANCATQLVWPILHAHLSISPLRFPRDCASLTLLQASSIILSLCRHTVGPSIRSILSSPNWNSANNNTISAHVSRLVAACDTLHRCLSGMGVRYTGSFCLLASLLRTAQFVLSSDRSCKTGLSDIHASVTGLARSPDAYCIQAICSWLADDRMRAISEAEGAIAAAQRLKDSTGCAAGLALSFFVRGEVRRGVLARGEASARSFEWVDDLRRADKENPSILHLSSLSMQAAFSQGASTSKQAQAAMTLISVFEALGMTTFALDESSRDVAAATDHDWAAQLDSMTSLLTYFPTAAELMDELAVQPEPMTTSNIPIEKMTSDERFNRLRLLAAQTGNGADCESNPFSGRSPGQSARPPQTQNDSLESSTPKPTQCSPRAEAAGEQIPQPKLFRRYTTSTEAEMLRTQQSRSFVYQRTSSGATHTPRQFPRWRSNSSHAL